MNRKGSKVRTYAPERARVNKRLHLCKEIKIRERERRRIMRKEQAIHREQQAIRHGQGNGMGIPVRTDYND
jgi:hypothetical protein